MEFLKWWCLAFESKEIRVKIKRFPSVGHYHLLQPASPPSSSAASCCRVNAGDGPSATAVGALGARYLD